MSPELCVLVVTCNRPEKLRRLLEDLARQSLRPERFELLLSDDGSERPAERVAEECGVELPLRCVRGQQRGPAAARNRALALARAPLLLFLNDDVRLAPDLLETHLEVHASLTRPTAVMGTFDFTPEILEQPLNRLAQEMGLFGTSHIPPGVPLGPLAFCTGHLSVPTAEVLEIGGFDESFTEPAGEDLDLGYRLARERGMGLMLSTRAQAWHDHPHVFSTWWERWQMWGRALRQLAEKHRDPLFWPGGAASLDPRNQMAARARVLAQEPMALELIGWLERLSDGPPLEGEMWVEALERSFHLPGEAEVLMRIGLNTSMYVIQRAFWLASAP